MAKKASSSSGRVGAARGKSVSKDPRTGLWNKRDTASGRFTEIKKSGGSFKGVRREG